jgi:hypothetical protein
MDDTITKVAEALYEVKPRTKWATIGERKAWTDSVRAVAKVVAHDEIETEEFYQRAGMYGDRRDLPGPASPGTL